MWWAAGMAGMAGCSKQAASQPVLPSSTPPHTQHTHSPTPGPSSHLVVGMILALGAALDEAVVVQLGEGLAAAHGGGAPVKPVKGSSRQGTGGRAPPRVLPCLPSPAAHAHTHTRCRRTRPRTSPHPTPTPHQRHASATPAHLVGEALGPEGLRLPLDVCQRHAADARHAAHKRGVHHLAAEAVCLKDLGRGREGGGRQVGEGEGG